MSATSLRFLKALAPLLLVASGSALSRAQVSQGMASNVVKIPFGFHSGTVYANGTTLHYVRGGDAPPPHPPPFNTSLEEKERAGTPPHNIKRCWSARSGADEEASTK